MDAKYRAYVKDCLDLNGLPKAFLTVLGGDVSGDILTQSTSSFDVLDDIPKQVHEGDVISVYSPNGKTIYTGVITALEEKHIDCSSIYSLFDYDWFTRYWQENYLEMEIADIFNDFISNEIGEIVENVPDANDINWYKNKIYYKLTNEDIYDQYQINRTGTPPEGGGDIVYSYNRVQLYGKLTQEQVNSMDEDSYQIVRSIPEANYDNWLKNVTYLVKTTNNGDVYAQYKISKDITKERYEPEHHEDATGAYTEVTSFNKVQLTGVLSKSQINDQPDKNFRKKYGAFKVSYIGNQTVHLPKPEDNSEMRNMEQFIYDLYRNFNIVIEINIPFGSGCSIKIKTADYTGTKIAKNSANIIDIDPTTEVEDTNKLVVFSSNGAYRGTFYGTDEGIVVASDDKNRLPFIQTAYIFSDDELDDIQANNLKKEMHNHELVFTMSLINKIYDFYEWPLGMPLEIHYKEKTYYSVYTGYSFSFSEGEHPSFVDVSCGIVRTKLTDKLNMFDTDKNGLNSSRASSGTGGGVSGSGGGGGSSASLARVATTGKYSDLSGKPTIQTISFIPNASTGNLTISIVENK